MKGGEGLVRLLRGCLGDAVFCGLYGDYLGGELGVGIHDEFDNYVINS